MIVWFGRVGLHVAAVRGAAYYTARVSGNDEPPVRPAGSGLKPRLAARFNEVYRADGFGHLSVWFAGGRTGRVVILVGADNPPTDVAGEVTADMPSSGTAMIRPGEYWMLNCDRKNGGGFKAVFTPMY